MDRVQWQVFLLTVFEILDSVHFIFPVNNCRNDSISASLSNCAQEGVPSDSQTPILECTYGVQLFLPSEMNVVKTN
jgi:hypothetical protein